MCGKKSRKSNVYIGARIADLHRQSSTSFVTSHHSSCIPFRGLFQTFCTEKDSEIAIDRPGGLAEDGQKMPVRLTSKFATP